jgi:hypothetical protein
MKIFTLSLAATLAALLATSALATDAGSFKPFNTFATYTAPQPINAFRDASGRPGPLFWQNRADYQITAALEPTTRKLSGSEVISYTNHSPDALDVIWLQVEQNRYKKDARGAFGGGNFPTEFTDGEHIRSVEVEDASGHRQKAHWLISDTRMQVTLPQPLKAIDGKLKLHITWDYAVPGEFGGRNDWNANAQGDIFEMAQWYPRVCVYDDLRGWDTQPFLNSEFYLEYGDFDYRITVPSNMIVVGSGELLNPQEVLTKTQRERLDKARHSDATVMIRSAAEVTDPTSRPKQDGTLTWHFAMKHTRDVAFGASKAYIWDAARMNLPDDKTALAMSAYPVESAGDKAWGVATQNLKKSVEFFSKTYFPYPYPVAINEAGTAGGMEYPGITFDHKKAAGPGLRMLIAHEIGHTWFPMIVGSNERRDAWMDEGFNTFVDVYEAEAFDGGKFAPKRDSEYAPGKGTPAEQIAEILKDADAPPPITDADAVPEKYRHPITYFKAAFGLVLLREQIIGPERFDSAFRRYIATWAYKHPSPSDFFRFMDSAAGEDLGWFWRGWFEHNWQFDMAVTKAAPTDGDWNKGADVTVANLDQLPLPATMELTYVDGSTKDVRVPVETWLQHHSFVVHIEGTQKLKSVSIDPKRLLPDADRSNNSLQIN